MCNCSVQDVHDYGPCGEDCDSVTRGDDMLTKYLNTPGDGQSVIFDLDGCIADCSHRLHLLEGKPDWDAFFAGAGADLPIVHNLLLLHMFWKKGFTIILMTGRPERIRSDTDQWLTTLGPSVIGYDMLLMRADGDYRADHAVKCEMVRMLKEKGYNLILAFDDRAGCVDMFIEEGVPCLQVRAPDKMEMVKKYERVVEYISGEGTEPGTRVVEGTPPEAA